MRIIAVTPSCPRPDESGGDRRLVALLEILASTHRVHLCVLNPQDGDSARIERLRRLPELRHVHFLPSGFSGFAWATLWNAYDFGLFEFYSTAGAAIPSFRRRQPLARTIVDTVDVHFAREESGAQIGLVSASTVSATRESELGVYRSAHAVIAASQNDAQLLMEAGGIDHVSVIPIIAQTRPRHAVDRREELLFVGGFRHPPNPDGLRWFLQSIWPSIRSRVPTASLTVIGSGSPPVGLLPLLDAPGIRHEGQVSDVSAYLDRAAISVAPLRYGAGMKGKVVDAMASGLPVVTTSTGAQGLGAISGTHLVIAESSEGFADAVVSLLQNPSRAATMGTAGQLLIEQLCSPRVVRRVVEELLATFEPAGSGGLFERWRRITGEGWHQLSRSFKKDRSSRPNR